MNINQDNESLSVGIVDEALQDLHKRLGDKKAEEIEQLAKAILTLISSKFKVSCEFHEAIQLIGRLSTHGKQVAAEKLGITVEQLDKGLRE